MKLARNPKLYSSSHDACNVFDNIVKIVGRCYFILNWEICKICNSCLVTL